MHWDVVEVKVEPHYCLLVRFKDGLAGRVQLRRDDLTGVLEPLRDEQFFGRVFIDSGAVAWRRMQCTLRSPVSLANRMNRNRLVQARATAERQPTHRS